ncbi:hypothetical protein ON058_06295 [Demequina sp. B12]|uniref:hypothetical protein n=1 Tax=Demequina sp. B12 TaxID=2992757 RepID=UPI00237A6116|nr:hypothetical protein [Demequina sp. B12]MDE0573019.1 hypothetical protein [Demequina sp. B12]
MYVVTADQRGSTRVGEKVDEVIADRASWAEQWADAVVLPLERTVGDEMQTVVSTPAAALDLALGLTRTGEWSVGIGVGAVNRPLGKSSRQSSGQAFVEARRAVERARGRAEPVPLVVAGGSAEAEERATAVMQLLGAVVERRTDAGWEVAELAASGASQKEIAHALGISPQAVSQRKASALIDEEIRARAVAEWLLSTAHSEALASGPQLRQDDAL